MKRKSSRRGGMNGRKRRIVDCSDDSDEDFVVDEYEDNDDMDRAVDDEDDGGLSGSDETDAEARRKKPRRNLSRLGVRGRKRKGRLSNEKVDEDDEEFDPGMEYVTDDDESVVSEKALVKKQATKRRTGKVASTTHRKSVLRSGATNKRKRHVGRRKKPEDGRVAGGERLGRKRTRLESRTKRARKLKPRLDSDSDSDFIVSEAEIGALTGVSIGRALETRLRSSWWLTRRRSACKSEHRLHKVRRSKRAGKVDGIEYNGYANISNLCKEVCGICLSEERRETIRGRLDSCDHFFCFACIMEWSKVESRCPMCKQRFVSINRSSKCGICLGDVSIRVPRRNQVYQPSEEELRSYLDPYANIVCTVCHGGGDDNLMLLCDICDSSAHTYCVDLGREVPEGNWYCEGCRSFDLGVSNLQRDQDPAMDQLVDSSLCSERFIGNDGTPIPSKAVSECLKTSPARYSSQRGNLSPQSPFCGDPGITSQVSGFGAATVMSRRTLRHQIHRLITNNRMSQTLDLPDIGNIPISAIFRSDAIKSEVEQDDGGKECFGGLEHDSLCDHVDNSGDRCGTLADTFGESSSRQLQHREFFSGENLSLDDFDTRCLVSCTGSNFSHNSAEVVHSEVAYSEGTRGVEKDESKDKGRIFQLHDVKQQVCSLVKHHLKAFARDAHIRRCEFKDIARRSTHTIVATYGYKCSSNMDIVVQPPSCCHAPGDFGLGNLAKHCCFNCFNTFVGGVVQKIMKNVMKF